MKMKIKQKNPRTVKGMTLLECIIAMFAVSIMGLMMVHIVTTSCNVMRDTTHLNKKVAAQAPYAAGQNESAMNAKAASIAQPTDPGEDISISVSAGGVTDSNVRGRKYSTAGVIDPADLNTQSNMSGDLEFYHLEPYSEPTT